MFRNLRANEIECRVALIKENGLQLLLYKDARVDMNILDETVGALNWQKSYQLIDGQLFCTIEIWDEKKNQWIKKQDVGVESYTEKEKGRASDAQKRACFAAGIGRELYSSPFIWVPSDKCRIEQYNGKLRCRDSFKVHTFEVADGEIVKLAIYNTRDNNIVYRYGI